MAEYLECTQPFCTRPARWRIEVIMEGIDGVRGEAMLCDLHAEEYERRTRHLWEGAEDGYYKRAPLETE